MAGAEHAHQERGGVWRRGEGTARPQRHHGEKGGVCRGCGASTMGTSDDVVIWQSVADQPACRSSGEDKMPERTKTMTRDGFACQQTAWRAKQLGWRRNENAELS
jgi:hypothetical protein